MNYIGYIIICIVTFKLWDSKTAMFLSIANDVAFKTKSLNTRDVIRKHSSVDLFFIIIC